MRIHVLSQWYRPEPDSKIHLLAHDLAARGHQVTTITGFPNYPSGKVHPGYRIRWRQWETMDGVRVLRVPLYPSHDRSALRRSLNYFSFAASASLFGEALCGPADVMWVYHPPLTVGVPALVISLLRGIPFVYEVQDMWPESVVASGMLPDSAVVRWLGRLAGLIYRRATAITVISPGFKRNLIAKGVPAEKIHVIPNWADEDVYQPVPRDEALAAEHGMAGRFNVVYGGNMGTGQAMDNVLAAAALLGDLAQVQLVLIGDGVDEAQLRQAAQARGLDNVRFVGRQPIAAMPRFFALADVLLVHLRRDPLYDITIPSKTIAYLACGRPILSAVAGDAAEVVREAGAGLICTPEDPAALAQAVRNLYSMPDAQREAMGQAGRRAYLANYTRAVLMDRYETLLADVAMHHRMRG